MNTESFSQNFKQFIRNSTNYYTLKKSFESIDSYNNGLLSKVDFCSVINRSVKSDEYRDEDIMKFIRITSIYKDNMIKYPEFLDIIFFDNKADSFNEMVNLLHKLHQQVKGDYKEVISTINISKYPDYVDINTMYNYFKTKLEKVNKNTVCKLDIDQDGKISKDDLKNVLERYLRTSFFKYENKGKQTHFIYNNRGQH